MTPTLSVLALQARSTSEGLIAVAEMSVGTLGGWDQHGFRQNVVLGYGMPLQWLRPAFNLWAQMRGRPSLPAPGKTLRFLTAALPVVSDNNPGVLSSLVDHLIARKAGGPWSHLLVGLHEADPLLPLFQQYEQPVYVIPHNPTAENIARLIFEYTQQQGFPVVEVTMWETRNSSAAYGKPQPK